MAISAAAASIFRLCYFYWDLKSSPERVEQRRRRRLLLLQLQSYFCIMRKTSSQGREDFFPLIPVCHQSPMLSLNIKQLLLSVQKCSPDSLWICKLRGLRTSHVLVSPAAFQSQNQHYIHCSSSRYYWPCVATSVVAFVMGLDPPQCQTRRRRSDFAISPLRSLLQPSEEGTAAAAEWKEERPLDLRGLCCCCCQYKKT